MNVKNIISSVNTLGFIVRISLFTVAIIPLLIYFVLNNIAISNNFLSLEKKSIQSKCTQALTVIKSKAVEIEKVAKDYGIWDGTYTSIQQADIKSLNENVIGWIPDNFGVDLIIIVNKDKQVIDSFGFDETKEALDKHIIDKILTTDWSIKNDPSAYGIKTYGLKVYNHELYLIGVSPILMNYYRGSCNGALIIGKKVTPEFLSEIKRQFGYRISIYSENKLIACPEEYYTANRFFSNILINNYDKDLVNIENLTIVGALPIEDISGKNLGYLSIIESRDIFLSTLNLIQRNGYMVFLLSITIIILLSIYLKNIIVSPIKHLENQITKMGQNNTLDYVNIVGSSEIKSLTSAFNRMITSLYNAEKENEGLKALSIRDSLTNLYNHRYFFEYFKQKTDEGLKQMVVMFCDIDYFRTVNDIHGHVTGDIVLKEIGNIISQIVSVNGKVFRYSGGKFAILLENYTIDASYDMAEQIRIKVYNSEGLQKYSGYFPLTISIGIASYPLDALNIMSIIDKADKAMYFSKLNGRNQCHVYSANIDDLLDLKSNEAVAQDTMIGAVYALATAIDAKDSYTEKHSESVVKYSLLLAEKLKMSERDKYMLNIGGLLHDCGKIGIPDEIIHKPGALTSDERKIINNHPILGSNIVKHIIKAPEIEACVRNHHERWDGKGYPDGLSGTSISIYARIICIADVYHAITSDRPYRKAMSKKEAIEQLILNKGAQFDPELADVFIQLITEEEK